MPQSLERMCESYVVGSGDDVPRIITDTEFIVAARVEMERWKDALDLMAKWPCEGCPDCSTDEKSPAEAGL